MGAPDLFEELRTIAFDAGLVALGVARAEPFPETRTTLVQRKAEGLHGGMQFTYRNPERSTDPQRLLSDARSLVVGAWPYAAGEPSSSFIEGPAGRVARYAVADYYGALRAALDVVADRLQKDGHSTKVVIDDNGLVDRAAAHRAGIGWWGKNSNLLIPGAGSWVVLGAIVTDAELSESRPLDDGCGTCRRCLDGCPTQAIIAPGVLDARKCLAWLVQTEGSFPVEFREALGDRIYGCDDCQEVCPPSRRSPQSELPIDGKNAWVDLVEMIRATDEELLARHGRWYIAKRDPRFLRRNALIGIGNTAEVDDVSIRLLLTSVAEGTDDLLAEHAAWALQRLNQRAANEQPDPARTLNS